MAEKTAWLNWNEQGKEWVLRLWEGDGWFYEDSWKIEERGVDKDGNSLDVVCDNALCYLAGLHDEGYVIKVTIGGNYHQ